MLTVFRLAGLAVSFHRFRVGRERQSLPIQPELATVREYYAFSEGSWLSAGAAFFLSRTPITEA